jgi:hypothetical protein
MGCPFIVALLLLPAVVALDFECSETPLTVEYSIKYYSGVVNCGNLLLESDIGGTHKWIAPTALTRVRVRIYEGVSTGEPKQTIDAPRR